MNEERLNELLDDINDALWDLKNCKCNVDVTTKGHKWETYYGLDNDLIKYIRKIENSNKNLQSKIDKAIEIDKIARKYFNKQIPRNIREQGFLNEIYNYLCNIEDILKEDK